MSQEDRYGSNATGLTSPATRHFSITPSDTLDLAIRPRALRFNTTGTVVVQDALGTQITYNVAAGEVLPIRPARVMETGTTATGIVGWD